VSLFTPRPRRYAGEAMLDLIPSRRPVKMGSVAVTSDTAMRHSAVWACLRLRSNLMATFPLDLFRKERIDGVDVRVTLPTPQLLIEPGGPQWDYLHWMKARQMDLDRAGNCIGLITEKNALGLPARIDLQPIDKCKVIRKATSGNLVYKIDNKEYAPEKVWHERVNLIAGLDVGLSPIAYAAWTIGEYLSLQQFALDWFGAGGVPKARLRNTQKTLKDKEAGIIKDRWKASISNGDLFVHGSDWEYDFMQAEAMGSEWLEGRRFGLTDVSRFFDCPADLIDAAINAPGTITYQSALARNLQFLVMNMQPAVTLAENNLSKTQPKPRFVKLNTGALLRMDPETQAKVIHARILDKTLTNPEARALYDLPPLTLAEIAQFDVLYGAPRTNPTPGEPPTVKAAAEFAAEVEREAGFRAKRELAVTLAAWDALDAREPVHAIATVGERVWEEPSR